MAERWYMGHGNVGPWNNTEHIAFQVVPSRPAITGHIYYPLAHKEDHQRNLDVLECPYLHDDEVTLLKRFRAQTSQLKLKHLATVHHRVLFDLYFKFPLIPAEPDYVPPPPPPYSRRNRFWLSRLQKSHPRFALY
ncbi:hypothetical protein SCLCIDRAFT_34603 [Scleroderma citrinum Foug A]|uniref:Uncharacterized protein n=1 Tax=Scleroderma citrinum Foug A TaxID=1036808 RepID=A0A0C3D177_9AGAM|nr:hypothetical protein SCLCIDRAFT_34603 [Scleroderma citrinum Foug A]